MSDQMLDFITLLSTILNLDDPILGNVIETLCILLYTHYWLCLRYVYLSIRSSKKHVVDTIASVVQIGD